MGNLSSVHPYIPNSVEEVQKEMLKDIGVNSIDDLYEDIPQELRFKGEMNLPEACESEFELRKHVEGILAKNISTSESISFLGGGSYKHFVPSVVDEVINRSEFLTAYAGEPYEDHGRFQALFEYESLMGELLDCDVVNVPTYDWGQAASTACRMAGRLAERDEILVCEAISPDRMLVIKNYCEPVMKVKTVKVDQATGEIDLEDLKSKITEKTAGVYFENPNYFGVIESNGQEISDIMHNAGAEVVVGVDPVSLGILTPPMQYGADIVCGDIQGLGNHMGFGGTLAGFIGTRDEERYVMEFPSRLFGIAKTEKEGEWGFDDVAYDRTSFGVREKGKEFIGTAAALYGIATAVHLSLMGPEGMKDVGQLCLQKSLYLKKKLQTVNGVAIKHSSASFKEFVVDFSGCKKSLSEINKALLAEGIFGGKELTGDFDELKNCALFCVTETIGQKEIDKLIEVLTRILN
ncbi:MAG: aminomethyl-transferring glycine dehydrogenase subunit GcvPA [Rhodothermaceae bacterium]